MSARRRIKVVFVLTTPDAVGGTERSTCHVTSALARCDDLDVSVLGVIRDADRPHFAHELTVPLHHVEDRRADDGRAVTDRYEPSSYVDPAWERALSASTDRGVEAALHADPPDVVVATTPALLALLVNVAPAGTAVVGVEHRASSTRGRTGEPLRRFGHLADALVSLTPDGTEWFARTLGTGAPRLATIANLVPDRFVPRSSLRRTQVLAAGRLVRSKQLHHVAEAFAASAPPDWRLRILGDGPERAALGRLAVRLDVHDRVELVPWVPDVAHELAKSSMLVMSSLAEGQPLVALEALAAGVPIVSYDCPVGPRTIVDHGSNGLLVPPNDRSALGEAMRMLIDDADLRDRFGAAARRSRVRFAPDSIASAWHDLIVDLAGGPVRRTDRAVAVAAEPGADEAADATGDGGPWVPQGGLLLHVGPHKTGTTAVQSAFSAARPSLAELGVVYPGSTPAPHGAVMNRLGTNRGWDDAIAPGSQDGWRQLCVETRSAVGTVVVSSEALCHATVEQAAEVLTELRAGPARVAITLRPLELVLPSSWQEYVKSGWTTTFDQFLHAVLDGPDTADTPVPTFWQRQDHGALVERWVEAVGSANVVVVVADPERRDHLHRTFESLLALPAGTLPADAGNTNRSLSADEVEMLRRVNLAVKGSVPWETFNLLLRQGGTTALVERRRPSSSESVVRMPGWAVERARTAGARSIERIRACGVRVEGDLDALCPTSSIDEPAEPATPPDHVSIDAVVELVVGLLVKVAAADRQR